MYIAIITVENEHEYFCIDMNRVIYIVYGNDATNGPKEYCHIHFDSPLTHTLRGQMAIAFLEKHKSYIGG